MYEFGYTKPSSLAEAQAAIAEASDGKLLAGGMTLIPTLKQRLAQPSDIIDLAGIEELSGIRRDGDLLVIGAMTSHAAVAASEVVRSSIPALADLADGIGDLQVRNCGTLGGSIANNDPAADYPAGLVGLGATVTTTKRQLSADEFFTGLFETALDEDEIVTSVTFPIPEKAAYSKFPNPASRYAIVGVFVARTGGSVRVAVTGAGPCVFRAPALEAALAASFLPDAVSPGTVPAAGLNGDIHATPEYRAHLVDVMTRRAVSAAAA